MKWLVLFLGATVIAAPTLRIFPEWRTRRLLRRGSRYSRIKLPQWLKFSRIGDFLERLAILFQF